MHGLQDAESGKCSSTIVWEIIKVCFNTGYVVLTFSFQIICSFQSMQCTCTLHTCCFAHHRCFELLFLIRLFFCVLNYTPDTVNIALEIGGVPRVHNYRMLYNQSACIFSSLPALLLFKKTMEILIDTECLWGLHWGNSEKPCGRYWVKPSYTWGRYSLYWGHFSFTKRTLISKKIKNASGI